MLYELLKMLIVDLEQYTGGCFQVSKESEQFLSFYKLALLH